MHLVVGMCCLAPSQFLCRVERPTDFTPFYLLGTERGDFGAGDVDPVRSGWETDAPAARVWKSLIFSGSVCIRFLWPLILLSGKPPGQLCVFDPFRPSLGHTSGFSARWNCLLRTSWCNFFAVFVVAIAWGSVSGSVSRPRNGLGGALDPPSP